MLGYEPAVVIGVAIPVSLIAAATVHFRMLDDWRAKWQIGVLTETREGAAGKQGHSEWH